jgi:hypothetical protein
MTSPPDLPDGLYFGLDEDTYRAVPALGSTDLKRLLVNPVSFWANSEPGKTTLRGLGLLKEEEADEEESLGKLFGRACHVQVLEPERFDDAYVEKEDMPVDYLASRAEIGEELLKVGAYCPPASALRADYVMAAKRAGLKVSDDWKVDELIRAEGRDILSKRWMSQLRMIDYLLNASQPALDGRSIREDTLTGGHAEVSVIWTDEATGIRCKARFDYLRLGAIIDLKTYSCPADLPPVSFFLGQVARYGYDFQRSCYVPAWKAMGQLIADGKVFGDHDPKWVRAIKVDREPLWRWVAVQTMGMPEVDWVDWNAQLAAGAADAQRQQALAAYAQYRDRFGLDTPWVALRGRIVVDDVTLDASGVARRMMSRGEPTWTASA